jgi:5,10-methylenetetrahydrofolate reductase
MMKNTFKEKLEKGHFVITAEVGPPKGLDHSEMEKNIDMLVDKVDALNVTDNQSSVMRYPSIGGCLKILKSGGIPILQMTCRDRNRMALESDLLFASSIGVQNVLALTGDYVTVGDHPQAKPVFDIDSTQLIEVMNNLSHGRDSGNNELDGDPAYYPEFYPGAIVTPEANPIEPQMIKFEKKVRIGAKFFQTQAIYDLEKFKKFMDFAKKFEVKILAGLVLLTGAGMAKYMNKNVPGIFVPQNLIDELTDAGKEKGLAKGIKIAGRMIAEIKEKKLADGVHIMAIGKEDIVPEILEAAGIGVKEKAGVRVKHGVS